MTTATDRFLDVAGLAELLGLPSTRWVYEQTAGNRIPHTRLGKYIRFSPEDVEAIKKQYRRGGGA